MEQPSLSLEVEEELQRASSGGDTVLYLNYQGLTSLPSILFGQQDYTHITRIYVKRNKLSTLPDDIGRLTSLCEIYAPANEIAKLPNSLALLRNLQSLDVSSNSLQRLPPVIGDLHSLEYLSLANNKLMQIPPDIGKLKNLKVLDVLNNEINELPVELCDCSELSRLLLDKNNITWLPRQMCLMRKLEEISATKNRLLCLPLDLGDMKNLRHVYVDGNPYLHALPVSLFRQEIGFNGCGALNYEDDNDVRARTRGRYDDLLIKVRISHTADVDKVVYLPREITGLGRSLSVPAFVSPLLDLTLRAVHAQRDSVGPDDLPRDLYDLVHYPTCCCSFCRRPIFRTALPLVFEGQVCLYSLYRLCVVCSPRCLRLATLSVNLPLIYPSPSDLSLAIAIL